jgi:ABC-type sugar transport system substrate-binding protein
MKSSISTLIAMLAVILALAGFAAPIAAQEWSAGRIANELPVGSTPWWQAMDREGRGGNGGN